ncbi:MULTISPECIES: hypothetical protein [Actinosynnema]|uniref:hypothetical protein n=1 Tax=Actinosynnema TaxID=40566 RepID=UPI0020A45069|nr:hypothetical protein [Actinosynnema pretiosum]MCP2094614.1 hypothetical protein [Actinosynnema pretiosum]
MDKRGLPLAGSLLLGALLIGGALLWTRGAPTAPPARPPVDTPSRYAFTTSAELSVAEGEDVLASAPLADADSPEGDGGGDQEGDPSTRPVDDPAWTADGRFAFTVVDAVVVALEAGTGSVRRIPCACPHAAPLGESDVAWIDADGLRRVDPAAGTPALDPRAVPAPPEGAFHPTLVGSLGERVYLTQELIASASVDADRLYALDRDGAVTELLPDTSTIEAVLPGPGGLLVHAHRSFSACESYDSVILLPDSGNPVPFALDGIDLVDSPQPRTVHDLWWAGDVPRAAIRVWRCPEEPGVTGEVWESRGERWGRVSEENVVAQRDFANGDRVTVTSGRDLVFSRRGTGERGVANDVLAVAPAP